MVEPCYFHNELTEQFHPCQFIFSPYFFMYTRDKLSLDCGLCGGYSVRSCNIPLVSLTKSNNKQTKLYSAKNWHQQGTLPTAMGSAKTTVIHIFSFKGGQGEKDTVIT